MRGGELVVRDRTGPVTQWDCSFDGRAGSHHCCQCVLPRIWSYQRLACPTERTIGTTAGISHDCGSLSISAWLATLEG